MWHARCLNSAQIGAGGRCGMIGAGGARVDVLANLQSGENGGQCDEGENCENVPAWFVHFGISVQRIVPAASQAVDENLFIFVARAHQAGDSSESGAGAGDQGRCDAEAEGRAKTGTGQ